MLPCPFTSAWQRAGMVGGLCLVSLAGACAPAPQPRETALPSPPTPEVSQWQEEPVPDGAWRPYLLKRCRQVDGMAPAAEQALAESTELLGEWEGSDAIMVLELYLQEHDREGLILLALAQFYVLAGQGTPQLLPREGPAADVGDWPRNQARLLARFAGKVKKALRIFFTKKR